MSRRPAGAEPEMKPEYDFFRAERGKFSSPGAVLVPPVHLEPDVVAWLRQRADARGVSLSALVNELLREDIALIEAAE